MDIYQVIQEQFEIVLQIASANQKETKQNNS